MSRPDHGTGGWADGPGTPREAEPPPESPPDRSAVDDTLDLGPSVELAALLAEHGWDAAHGAPGAPSGHAQQERGAGESACTPSGHAPEHASAHATPSRPDLLDSVADWPAPETPVGTLRLAPVRLDRDLRLIAAWMNDPAVAAFWELAGPQEVTAAHLRRQLEGDGRSVPCLGVLDGVPMSYWEIYRADLAPIARYCRARPHDTGLHLLIGGVPDRGRGLGTALLRAVADLVLDRRPDCGRVLAEPDVRNIASVAAFLGAGFRLSAEVDLPGKRAALMVRDRALREVL